MRQARLDASELTDIGRQLAIAVGIPISVPQAA